MTVKFLFWYTDFWDFVSFHNSTHISIHYFVDDRILSNDYKSEVYKYFIDLGAHIA